MFLDKKTLLWGLVLLLGIILIAMAIPTGKTLKQDVMLIAGITLLLIAWKRL